jgi:hypothetical protein
VAVPTASTANLFKSHAAGESDLRRANTTEVTVLSATPSAFARPGRSGALGEIGEVLG